MPNLTPHSRQISPSDQGGSEDSISVQSRAKNTTAHATRHKSYKMDYNRVKNLDQFLATLIMDNTH